MLISGKETLAGESQTDLIDQWKILIDTGHKDIIQRKNCHVSMTGISKKLRTNDGYSGCK
jgi:hypothetical protein